MNSGAQRAPACVCVCDTQRRSNMMARLLMKQARTTAGDHNKAPTRRGTRGSESFQSTISWHYDPPLGPSTSPAPAGNSEQASTRNGPAQMLPPHSTLAPHEARYFTRVPACLFRPKNLLRAVPDSGTFCFFLCFDSSLAPIGKAAKASTFDSSGCYCSSSVPEICLSGGIWDCGCDTAGRCAAATAAALFVLSAES